MKKIIKSIIFALAMICSTSAMAQDAENAVGVNFGYMVGPEGMSNLGLGIKYDRFLSESLRFELAGMYYFKSKESKLADYPKKPGNMKDDYTARGKDCDWFDINLNAHYLFNITYEFKFYPIFGFAGMIGKTSFDWDKKADNESELPFVEKDKVANINKGYSDSHMRFGCNLGVGAQYNITDDFGLTFEAKYKLIKDFGNFNMALGCVILF